MKKIFLLLLVLFLFSGCADDKSIIMIGGSGGGSGNTTFIYTNITNNITQSINVTNNLTQNFTTINNLTNNITNNIDNNFYTNITNNFTNNITQNITTINNITNNITQYINTTFNITNNISVVNNITQFINTTFNITNNITNNISGGSFSGVLNLSQINTSNIGSLGKVLIYNASDQGTWITPSSSSGNPGGNDRQLQFNNGSAFSGTDKIVASPSGFLNIANPTNIVPTINPSTGMILYPQKRGAETVLTYLAPSGVDRIVQPNWAYENIAMYVPAESSTATAVPLAIGFTAVAPIGTVTSPTQTNLNFPLAIERTRFIGISASGGIVELKGGIAKYFRGNASKTFDNGGFKLVMRYNPYNVSQNVSGCFGMVASTGAYTNVSNCFVGANAVNGIFAGFNRSENLTYYIANATRLEKVFSCGPNYPVRNNTVFFETTIYAQPKQGNISIYTIRLDTNDTPPCVWEQYGTNMSLPNINTPMTFRMWMGRQGVNGTTLGIDTGLDFSKLYIASDN